MACIECHVDMSKTRFFYLKIATYMLDDTDSRIFIPKVFFLFLKISADGKKAVLF